MTLFLQYNVNKYIWDGARHLWWPIVLSVSESLCTEQGSTEFRTPVCVILATPLLKDKRQITAVFCGTIQGDFLPVQVIYKGTTQHCHPCFKFPPGWHVTHSKNHWSMEQTMIEYIHNVIIPYVSANRESDDQAALVIMDNFKGQVTDGIALITKLIKTIVTALKLYNTRGGIYTSTNRMVWKNLIIVQSIINIIT